VEGAEGAFFLPIPGARDAFFFLVCTSLKPSVLKHAATIVDQASFFFSLTASLLFPRARAMVGFRIRTGAGLGNRGLGKGAVLSVGGWGRGCCLVLGVLGFWFW